VAFLKKIHFSKKNKRFYLADLKKYSIIYMKGRTVAIIQALIDNYTVCLFMVNVVDYEIITIIK